MTVKRQSDRRETHCFPAVSSGQHDAVGVVGDDRLLLSKGYSIPAELVQVSRNGESWTTEVVWQEYVLRTKKLYAHDEANDANVGDKVRVMETRPLSKNKRWRITDILERAK